MKKIIVLLFIVIISSCKSRDCNDLDFIKSSTNERIIGLKDSDKPHTGKCKFLYENGKTKSSREYLKGKYHGSWKFYYENGNIETQGQYNKGKKNGEWKYYYETGKIKQLSYYKNGEGVIDGALQKKIIVCSPLTMFAILSVIRQSMDNFAISKTSGEILEVLGGFEKQWENFKDRKRIN